MSDETNLERTGVTGHVTKAIIVDPDGLKRLDNQIQEFLRMAPDGAQELVFQYAISYSDGSTHRTHNFERVLGDENLTTARITEITIAGRSDREKARWSAPEIRVSLEPDWWRDPPASADFSASGASKQWVMSARDRISRTLHSMALGYGGWLPRIVAFAATVIATAGLAVGGWVGLGHLEHVRNPGPFGLLGMGLLCLFLLAVIYVRVAAPTARCFLPLVVFAIGQGRTRYETAVRWRRGLVYLLFVVIILGTVLQVFIIPWINAIMGR